MPVAAPRPVSWLLGLFAGASGGLVEVAGLPPLAAVATAAVVGAAGSLHCFLMCGPLACAASGSGSPRRGPLLAYHLGRVTAYALTGGLLGACGGGAAGLLSRSLQPLAPWLLVAALILVALDFGKGFAPIPALAQLLRASTRVAHRLGPTLRGALLGAITPLLPCGLLYGLFAAALAGGSFAGGALLLGGFALGAGPALLLAQLQVRLVGRRHPRLGILLRRGVPLVAAAVVAYRALTAASGASCH